MSEKSLKNQKHLQGLIIEQKCQLQGLMIEQFVSDGILGNLLMTLIDLVS